MPFSYWNYWKLNSTGFAFCQLPFKQNRIYISQEHIGLIREK